MSIGWKKVFLKGLSVAIPLGISGFLVWLLLGIFIDIVDLFPAQWLLFGIGQYWWVKFVCWALFLYGLGLFATSKKGANTLHFIEKQITWLPVVRSVYHAVKDGIKLLFDSKESLKQVVLIEYPRKGLWSMAFVTKKVEKDGKNFLAIFLPTTPNPTSGFILLMPEDEVKVLPISIEEGMKFVISLGSSGDHALKMIDTGVNKPSEKKQ